jgi:hypothetical protein
MTTQLAQTENHGVRPKMIVAFDCFLAATPERVEGSEFMTKLPTLLAGAPSMLWLEDFARVTA